LHRISSIGPAACLAFTLPATALALDSGASQPRVMLWHCSDAPLEGTGFPGCTATGKATRIEMGGSALRIEDVDTGGAASPADPRAMALDNGAIFLAWVAPGDGQGAYLLYAYDALNHQILSKAVTVEKGAEPPDAAAVAFLYRNMLGTSLYADLDSIESDTELWGLVFPENKVATVKQVVGLESPPPPPEPPRVHLGVGYALRANLGPELSDCAYSENIWHAINMALAVRAAPIVELVFDLDITPAQTRLGSIDSPNVALHFVAFMVGVRLRAVEVGHFSLLPGAGVGLGAIISKFGNGEIKGDDRKTSVHGSAWLSALFRFMLHRNVGFTLDLGAEVLFNTTKFVVEWSPLEPVDKLGGVGEFGLFSRFGLVFAL